MIRIRILFGLSMVFSMCVALNDSNNTDTKESSGSARILEQEFKDEGDGRYRFNFKTSNGISREESAELIPSIHDERKNVPQVKGSFSYPGPDGVMYSVNFVADESGFHPEGDHLQVPPFTPWIPGQPIDDGQYKADTSGQYKPDNKGQYKPDDVNSGNNVDNLNNPAKEKPKYTSGESILDANLPPRNKVNSVTPKYLPPTVKASQNPKPISELDVSDQYRKSSRVTTEYLPGIYTTYRPNLYSTGSVNRDFSGQSIPKLNIFQNYPSNSAQFNQPTSKPNVFENYSPNPAQYTKSPEFQKTNYAKPSQYNFPKPFSSVLGNSINPVDQPSEESSKYVRSIQPENQVKNDQKFTYFDINPEIRLLAGLL